jgi:uncharacterized C2H2 Zn-finger protein
MTEQNQNKHYLKCPYCACIFFSQLDLNRHIAAYGAAKEIHDQNFKKTHGRLEHGYGSDE